ncbi:FUSC family protein [Cohnella caldifontis]|uniref:FUSC family protein n=1 Tax=Cohnella caldifontis TaxID=3027471 RepID=UPI0023EBD4EA|nr:aromatic acid exporter family protein [Cohnella sp. YIM B05605]
MLSYRMLARFGLTLQTVKTAIASALAWWLATLSTSNSYPYFAPLAAILTIQVTVADSLEKAFQRIVGIMLGVAVSLFIGHWLQIGTLSIFLTILVGMAVSASLRLSSPIISQVGVSALLVLAFGQNQGYAVGRILETAIGCAVAVAINAAVVPPNAIPRAEASLLRLSRRAAATLRALAASLGGESGEAANDSASVEGLIEETEKGLQMLRLAKQSQKYSPFLARSRARIEILAYGMEQLEKVTVQIRGIRRSLADITEMEGDRGAAAVLMRIGAAIGTAAACVERFGERVTQASPEGEETYRACIERARSVQLSCLDGIARIESPEALREIGGILTDLNRILREVENGEPSPIAASSESREVR